MKRSPLARYKALRRTRILAHHHYTGPSAKVRRIVRERAGDTCEWPGCGRVGTEYQHRLNRKMGGRKGAAKERVNQSSWLLLVCRVDHDWLHAHPDEAYEMGWLLREGEDARQVPVLLDGGSWLLDDDGGRTEVP